MPNASNSDRPRDPACGALPAPELPDTWGALVRETAGDITGWWVGRTHADAARRAALLERLAAALDGPEGAAVRAALGAPTA